MTKTLSLVSADWIKALFIAIVTPVVGYIYTAITSGSAAINWNQVGLLALSSGLAYIIKQLGTSTTATAPVVVTENLMGVKVNESVAK